MIDGRLESQRAREDALYKESGVKLVYLLEGGVPNWSSEYVYGGCVSTDQSGPSPDVGPVKKSPRDLVQSSEFRVQSSEFRVQSSESPGRGYVSTDPSGPSPDVGPVKKSPRDLVQSSEFRVQSSEFRVQSSEFRVSRERVCTVSYTHLTLPTICSV